MKADIPARSVTGLGKAVYWLLQWTWGIVQNLAGFAVWAFLMLRNPRRRHWTYQGAACVQWNAPGSMGLGMFVFFAHQGSPDAARVMVHEYGHTLQSCVLGPLFLPVIALPSVLWSNLPACRRHRAKRNIRYTAFYPERWASSWGERFLGRPALWD